MDAVMALHEALAAVCPLVGVAIGDPADKTTWRIDFAPGALPEERQAALAALSAFDPVAAVLPRRVYAGDILDALSDADYAAVKAAVAQNATLARWWDTLLSRANPIDITAPRFTAAWDAFAGVVGKDRAAALYAALHGIAHIQR